MAANDMSPVAPAHRWTHPAVFLVLALPFGVIGGYLSVTIGWQLKQAGLSVEAVAALIATSYLPHTWKFLWAPISDITFTRRGWYLAAGLVTAVGIAATGMVPHTAAALPLLTAVVLASNFAVTFLGMSVESLMAHGTAEHQKGRAGGWFQAGALGGNGLGGGLGLWIAQHSAQPFLPGIVLGALCAACAGGLLFAVEPSRHDRHPSIPAELKRVTTDVWSVITGRSGMLALILCFLPIGSGAASNLFSVVASDWKASPDTVVFATGLGNGILSALGCMAGGFFSDRMDRKTAYVWFGIAQAACAVAMGALPHTERFYVVLTLSYAFITGLTYAGFTAFVLEAIGRGAAATKYNAYAALSNTPIMYMTTLDGWGHKTFGPAGMLYTEAVMGMIGLALFLVITQVVTRFVPERQVAAAE